MNVHPNNIIAMHLTLGHFGKWCYCQRRCSSWYWGQFSEMTWKKQNITWAVGRYNFCCHSRTHFLGKIAHDFPQEMCHLVTVKNVTHSSLCKILYVVNIHIPGPAAWKHGSVADRLGNHTQSITCHWSHQSPVHA